MKHRKIFIFGAGSGLGEGLLLEFQQRKHIDPKDSSVAVVDVYGFSRSGKGSISNWQSGTNHRFDLTLEDEIESFRKSWETQCSEWKQNPGWEHTQIIVYFAQGDGLFSPLEELNLLEIQKHFSLNLFSSMRVLQIMSDGLKQMSSSSVVFLSSTAAKFGFPNSTAYCASKHAVSGLAKSLREEWKLWGVKVINAYLGAIATPIWDDRPEFSKSDMVTLEDASRFLAELSDLPDSVYLDEVYITPKKGVL